VCSAAKLTPFFLSCPSLTLSLRAFHMELRILEMVTCSSESVQDIWLYLTITSLTIFLLFFLLDKQSLTFKSGQDYCYPMDKLCVPYGEKHLKLQSSCEFCTTSRDVPFQQKVLLLFIPFSFWSIKGYAVGRFSISPRLPQRRQMEHGNSIILQFWRHILSQIDDFLVSHFRLLLCQDFQTTLL